MSQQRQTSFSIDPQLPNSRTQIMKRLTKDDTEFEQRRVKRVANSITKFRYPFGLLTIMDLVCGTKGKRDVSQKIR